MSEKIKDTKVYTKVIKDIKEKILSGQLKNGDRLPSEREMAEKLEVSRTSIREAIRVLEIMGLIESKRGSGNYIA
ncbi:MAG: GntR family transcriptional regulator, partial [Clostridium celatum]|nr:GntR family transcriptional regulator [Clostridium celatum]